MDPLPVPSIPQQQENTGLIYRLHAGYRFRVAGDNAKNDGIQAEMDIAYRSRKFFNDLVSIETGSTLDLFGETEHLGAYLQLNYHYREHWIFSLRAMGGGVNDDKEKKSTGQIPTAATETEDTDDLGGTFDISLSAARRLDRNFILGIRVGYNLQGYGTGGGDQGTQHSLATLLNLAYQL